MITRTSFVDHEDETVYLISASLNLVGVYVELGWISMLLKTDSSLVFDEGNADVAATFDDLGTAGMATAFNDVGTVVVATTFSVK